MAIELPVMSRLETVPMRKWFSTSRAFLPMLAPVFGATLFAAGQSDQAADVLAQVTKALGGDAKVAAVKTLSAEGTYRRVMGENEMNGDLELYLGLPDKFQRVEQMGPRPDGMPGVKLATTFNGTEGWMGPLGPVPGGMMFRAGPGGPGGGSGIGPGGPGGPGGQRFDPTSRIRADYWRTALALLPGSAATAGLTFSYVGKAEAPDGQAEVLEAKGEGNFTARLFVDASSHLPIMITYTERDQSRMMRMARGPSNETEEQRRARFEEERKKREAEGPPPMVEYSWFLADYKKVDGVQLPHHFTLQIGDKPSQEWEIKKFKINPTLDAEQFKKKTSN
jgi:hypothetical protein